jgi:putative transposase
MPSRLFVNHLNRVRATDTTYIRTLQGWLFLPVVMDLYSRMVVGWAIRTDNRRDGPIDALFMAVKRRNPTQSVLIHSEQGHRRVLQQKTASQHFGAAQPP